MKIRQTPRIAWARYAAACWRRDELQRRVQKPLELFTIGPEITMRYSIYLLLYLLFLSCSQAAQTSGQTNKSFDLEGTVIDAISNQPIRRALVILSTGKEPGVGTYSDDSGRFNLHGIESGVYLISAGRTGFVADSKGQKQSVTVSADTANEAITIKLNRTGAISGRVVDADGQPVTGAGVQLQLSKAKKGQSSVGYAISDDRGFYRAYNIPPGSYKLAVTYSSEAQHSRVQLQNLKDKAKNVATEAYGQTYYPGTLDPAQATTIQVDAGADIQGIDVELHQIRAVRVRGKVNSADGESPGPFVMVVLNSMNGGNSADTEVRIDGSFEFAEVTPGIYTVAALGLLTKTGKQLTANQSLDVGETDIDGVQLTLGSAQHVSGTVVLPVSRKLPAGLFVVLQRRDRTSKTVADQSGGIAQVNENGTYSFENVAPGIYDPMLGSAGQGDDLYVSSIRSGDQDVLASGLHVAGSAPAPVEMVLKANGAEIDCSVVDEKQRSASEAHVLLLPDSPRRSQIALRGECETDAVGKCKLSGVAPGDYHVIALAKEDAGDFSDSASADRLETLGTSITLVEGDHRSIQLHLVSPDKQE